MNIIVAILIEAADSISMILSVDEVVVVETTKHDMVVVDHGMHTNVSLMEIGDDIAHLFS